MTSNFYTQAKLDTLNRVQRARFARTELFGRRAVKPTAAWRDYIARIAKEVAR